MSSVNMLYEGKLRSRSRMSEQFFIVVYRVCFVITGNIFTWYVKCSIGLPHKADGLRLNIC
jgi:hypothetical protein